MHRAFELAVLIGVILISGVAFGQTSTDDDVSSGSITVSILGVSPSDMIGEGEEATILWRIEGNGLSGTYQTEVGGDGSPGTGRAIASSTGRGSWGGTKNGSSIISADADLVGGATDAYQIYIIAISGSDSSFASTTITLANPPNAPTNLSAGIGDQAVFLHWNRSDSNDVDHYLVYYGNMPGSVAGDYTGSDAVEGASGLNVGNRDHFTLTGLKNDYVYYFRVSAIDTTNLESPLSNQATATPLNAEGATDLSGEKGGCFIATAAFGSIDHSSVKTLRKFRDLRLSTSYLGKLFIIIYYRISPSIASHIAGSTYAKNITMIILSPVVYLAGLDLEYPVLTKIGFLFLTMIGIMTINYLRKGRERRNG